MQKMWILLFLLFAVIAWGSKEGFCDYPVRRPWWHYQYPSWKCPMKWWPQFHSFNENTATQCAGGSDHSHSW